MRPYIELKQIRQEGNTLKYRFRSSLDVFRQEHFFIQYDEPLPYYAPSIQAIPFVALMMPVAWATGCNVILPYLDQKYRESLEPIRAYWKGLYSNWSFESHLFAKSVVNPPSQNTRTGLLFSGGLSSLCTYLRHRDKNPEVFTVIGADMPIADQAFISLCKEKIFDPFSRLPGMDHRYIETDIRRVLDSSKLKLYAGNWFGAVQFGMLLTGLTAPVSYRSLKTLLLAGCSHPPAQKTYCAGDPEVVRHLAWAGTQVEDDLNEVSRIEKTFFYLKTNPEFLKYLRVCWVQNEQVNCGRCEKCLRTVCELLMNNLDPNEANFHVTEDTLPQLKERLQKEFHVFFRGSESLMDYWRHMQQQADPEHFEDRYGAREFFQWLRNFTRLQKKESPQQAQWGFVAEKIRSLNRQEIARYCRKYVFQ